MRSHQLETALRGFVEEAALRLQADLDAGAEVPFELSCNSARGRGTQLYCYRPLTDAFLRERWETLEGMESYAHAARLLRGYEGLERYLLAREAPLGRGQPPAGVGQSAWRDRSRETLASDRSRETLASDRSRETLASGSHPPFGEHPRFGQRPRTRADAALRLVVGDVFAEQSDFSLREERLSGALARLDCLAHPGATGVTVVATLHGLAIASPELPLARGLTIARPDELPDVPDSVFNGSPSASLSAPLAGSPSTDGEDAGRNGDAGQGPASPGFGHLVVAFTTEDTDPLAAIAHGREVLGRLLRALRLFGDARIALGRLAWARVGAGSWGALALPWGGRPHGMLLVRADQEDELRAFCNLVSRRAPRDSELAWALARFEMGCERATDLQALSDYLLALRALLEPEGPSSQALAETGMFARGERLPASVAGRLAALCATPAERPELARRVARALALERAAIAGTAVLDARATALVRELAGHLGALLRDVICGHLRADLAPLADELLARPDEAAGGVGPATGMGTGPHSSSEEDLRDAGEAGEILNVPV